MTQDTGGTDPTLEARRMNRAAAAELGLTTFYTGKPCRHGHDGLRYTRNGSCVACTKAAALASTRAIRARQTAARSNQGETSHEHA